MTLRPLHYNSPPLQEAVCQISFANAPLLSREQIEEMGREWAAEFPDQETVENKSVSYQINMAAVEKREEDKGHKLICRSACGNRIVQLGSYFMTVNHLAEYPGWSHGFKDLILKHAHKVFEQYSLDHAVAISLRYIDRINIPQHPMNWQDWFDTHLGLPPIFQAPGAKIQFNYQNCLGASLFANMTVASLDASPEGQSSVIFDLDIASKKTLQLCDFSSELNRVHKPHRLAFESVLKDTTRDLFDPVFEQVEGKEEE